MSSEALGYTSCLYKGVDKMVSVSHLYFFNSAMTLPAINSLYSAHYFGKNGIVNFQINILHHRLLMVFLVIG